MGLQNILFIGDSLIEFFDWQARLSTHRVVNLGRSGETVQELEERSQGVRITAVEPDWIFIMIGTNNVVMDDYSFIPSYENIIATLKEKFPGATLVVTGLFPMRLSWVGEDAVPRLNDLLRDMALGQKCLFMDGCQVFAQSTLGLGRCFLDDGVHLSEHGYDLWAAAVEGALH